jgi:hypothetical protein
MVSYGWYLIIRNILAVSGGFLAIFTLIAFAKPVESVVDCYGYILIVIWTVAPPVWFFAEYTFTDWGWIATKEGVSKDVALVRQKIYADYASKIWAAVLAVSTFLFAQLTMHS